VVKKREVPRECGFKAIMHPIQQKTYKKMPPGKKLAIAFEFVKEAERVARAGLKARHPDWDEKRVNLKVREMFLYASD
jgi:hypothetical protein